MSRPLAMWLAAWSVVGSAERSPGHHDGGDKVKEVGVQGLG